MTTLVTSTIHETGLTIGKAFKVFGGGTPSTSVATFWQGSIPWITSADLDDNLKIKPRKRITKEAVASSATNLVPAGSVIVATRVSLGKVGIAETPLCFSQDCQGVIVDNKIYDPKFVALQLKQRVQIFRYISRGTTISGVTKKQLLDLPFELPSLNTQRSIVAEIEKQFSRLDEAVASLKRVKANLKRYKAAVLKAAVEGELTEDWRKQHPKVEPASKLLERILMETRAKSTLKSHEPLDVSRLEQLPKGWCWARIEDLGYVQLGRQRAPKYHSGKNMRPYLRVQNVFEDRIDLEDVKEMNFAAEDYKKFRLEPGDILLNEGQSPELLGRPAIYRGELPSACFTNTLIRFRAYVPLTPEYPLIVFQSYMRVGRFTREGTITTNIAHLSAGRFAKIEFPLPPLKEQQEIVVEVERRLSVIEELEASVAANLTRADRLRQSILGRAFSGSLRTN